MENWRQSSSRQSIKLFELVGVVYLPGNLVAHHFMLRFPFEAVAWIIKRMRLTIRTDRLLYEVCWYNHAF